MATTQTQAAYRDDTFMEEFLPESDGKPMAETDVHRRQMIDLLNALDEYFRDDPQVYVSGNIFLYYLDEAGIRQSVSPDIFVVRGIEKKQRRIYKLEDEGKAPEMVIELTSSSTKTEDFVTKRYVYAKLGVKEYFLFDPFCETQRPALAGFRLDNGDYMPMLGTRLRSETLGLDLVMEEGELRLYNPKTGERLRTYKEAEAERRAAKAENARLRKELARVRGKKS
jgi:Uma2 family endonuclease